MSAKRKKILVFSDWFLPGYRAGGPIRSLANLVNSVDHDFYIVTRITDHHSSEPYEGVVDGEWVHHSPNTQVMYLFEDDINESKIRPLIYDAQYDKIYINSLFSPLFALLPLRIARAAGLSSKVIVSPRGMLKKGALSVKSRKKKMFLFFARLIGLYKGITWEATNEQEVNEIKLHFGNKVRYKVAPNLITIPTHRSEKPVKQEGSMKLVCLARISREKGIKEAVQFLLDAQLEGNVELDFYGTQQNEVYLEECKQLAAQVKGVRIVFKGEVAPHAIPKLLGQYHFFYMPTLGENFGHAIAEALTHSTPVIISDRTPWKKMQVVKAGWDLPLESKPFVDVLRQCLAMGQTEYTLWTEGAFEFGCKEAKDPETLASTYAVFE
jgi:glycosyltransferase involved in cell wall biosynthesis